MQLAQRFNGEIIAADSRTVYRGLDIGTAKPTVQDRHVIRHHLIDIVDPDEPFTVADFQRLAFGAIADIHSRGKIPFLVGGSGLYIDSVIYNFSFRKSGSPKDHARFQQMTVEELQAEIKRQGLSLPENYQNPRHLIRVLETNGQLPQRSSLSPNILVIGLEKDKETLARDLTLRADLMVEDGLVEEVRVVGRRFGWEIPAMLAPAYKAFRQFIEGKITLDEAKHQFVRYDLQYAKRQKTWFKRSYDVHWISKPEEAVDLITAQLNK